MNTEGIKKFLEDVKNENIAPGEMETGREFFLSIGLLNGYFAIRCRDKFSKKGTLQHCQSIKKLYNFTIERYKTHNDNFDYDCHWQRQLMAIISEGPERFGRDTEPTTEDQLNITLGLTVAEGWKDIWEQGQKS